MNYGPARRSKLRGKRPSRAVCAGHPQRTVCDVGFPVAVVDLTPGHEPRSIGGSTPECVSRCHGTACQPLPDDDRIVVVVAPAGYGKTTLTTLWFDSTGSPIAQCGSRWDKALARHRATSCRRCSDLTSLTVTRVPSRSARRDGRRRAETRWWWNSRADRSGRSCFFDDVHALRGSRARFTWPDADEGAP